MEKQQIDIYDMGLSVENHFNDNPTAWSSSVPISNAKTKLSTILNELATQVAFQLLNTSSVTVSKQAARDNLQTLAHELSAAMSGYASDTDNKILYGRVHYTPTDFDRFRDAELIGVCVNLSQEATPIVVDLAPYGVLATTLTTFNAANTLFGSVMKDPEEAIAKRKSATDNIAVMVPGLTNFLETKMDNLIVALASSQPEFVATYHNVRSINDSPTRTLSLTTTCLDSETQQPIEGVTIKIPDEHITRVSGSRGFNTYLNIAEGAHTLSVSHPNYVSQEIEFTVVNSLTTELPILMVHL